MNRIIRVDRNEGIREDVTFEEALQTLERGAATPAEGFWLDFEEPTEAELGQLAQAAGIHELTTRELLNRKVREKWSEFGEYIYVVGHGLNFNPGQELFHTVKISILVYGNFVLSFHLTPLKTIEHVLERLREESLGKLPSEDWALYAILDALTDLYMAEVERFRDEVSAIDESVFDQQGGAEVLRRISEARRHLVQLQRRLNPKRDFLQMLCFRDHPQISRETQVYLRDVLDHVIRMIEQAGVARDTISDAQANYIAQVSNRMNAVMKTLSIVATVMMPLTLVAGLFGMNVHVPGQDAAGGLWFWGLIVAMTVMAVWMILYFRRKDWL